MSYQFFLSGLTPADLTDAYSVTANIQRASRVTDNAGGKTQTWRTVSEAVASMHLYARQSLFRRESVGAAAGGPGVLTRHDCFFEFVPTYPDVEVNDRIALGDGRIFEVKFVRPYETSMQVDCDRIT